ncbi:MAG: EAL domain-containing protein [Pseudomonadota bacterium]
MQIPKVLLVNDDPASLFALESLLTEAASRFEYELLTATSGKEALRQVLRHQFAVILLDVSMPGMDGFETAEAIHAHPRSDAVPIIFITAHFADEMHRLKAYQNGAVDYLFTPVIPQILQTKVAVFVEMTKKNIQLQMKSDELAKLNQDLRVQRVQDLERINAELQLEVAERKLAEQRANELSIRDALTGLVNRRALIQQLEHAVASADRSGSEFALLFLDLDRFKSINDTLGHEVGDELLRQVAARLTASVRVSDVVARLGGDEFVVLVEGKSAAANAARVARKIGLAHTRPFEIGAHRVKTSTSIGIGLYPHDAKSARALMKNADVAMYHAKQEQRGSIKFFHEELNAREREREQWRRELHLALAEGQFELYYQPRVELAGGRVVALEAQLQWWHPGRGLLAASAWLPAVPDRALLDLIDDWTLGAACAQAALWRDAAAPAPALPIAVNLVAAQLPPDLAHKLAARMRQHQLGAGSIELELPEPLLSAALDGVGAVLQELRAAGVPVSVDHFGSAGSSLAVCKVLPLAALKIDRAFVRAIGEGGDGGGGIAGAIVLLAHALALKAVALGVRTAAQLDTLRALGCDQYQGDLFCRPMAAGAVLAHLGLAGPAPQSPPAAHPAPPSPQASLIEDHADE